MLCPGAVLTALHTMPIAYQLRIKHATALGTAALCGALRLGFLQVEKQYLCIFYSSRSACIRSLAGKQGQRKHQPSVVVRTFTVVGYSEMLA